MTVKKSIFQIDRRDLLKWSSMGAAAMIFCDFDELYAAGVCDKLEELENLTGALAGTQTQASAGELFYWIDGPFGKSHGANQATHGRLAVQIDLPHNATSGFIEAVIVTDSSQKLVAQQRFGVNDSLATGKAPYAIFENLSFEDAMGYNIYYVMRKGDMVTVYRFMLSADKIRQSRMDYSHLGDAAKSRIPARLIQDISGANHYFGDAADEPNFGWVTTPYQNFADRPTHTVRAKVKQIQSGGDFAIEVQPMHGDAELLGHYMRYFLVLDPVGQIIGGIRRPYGSVSGSQAQQFVNNGSAFTIGKGLVGEDVANLFSAAERNAITERRILDCPYVHIIAEDVRDAIARLTVRLR